MVGGSAGRSSPCQVGGNRNIGGVIGGNGQRRNVGNNRNGGEPPRGRIGAGSAGVLGAHTPVIICGCGQGNQGLRGIRKRGIVDQGGCEGGIGGTLNVIGRRRSVLTPNQTQRSLHPGGVGGGRNQGRGIGHLHSCGGKTLNGGISAGSPRVLRIHAPVINCADGQRPRGSGNARNSGIIDDSGGKSRIGGNLNPVAGGRRRSGPGQSRRGGDTNSTRRWSIQHRSRRGQGDGGKTPYGRISAGTANVGGADTPVKARVVRKNPESLRSDGQRGVIQNNIQEQRVAGKLHAISGCARRCVPCESWSGRNSRGVVCRGSQSRSGRRLGLRR